MSNPKQLGAKQMLEQSVVYLYNSYREEGLNADRAKELVAKDIEFLHTKYQQNNLIPKEHKIGLSTPQSVADDILKTCQTFNWEDWRKLSMKQKEDSFRIYLTKISQKMLRLKTLL